MAGTRTTTRNEAAASVGAPRPRPRLVRGTGGVGLPTSIRMDVRTAYDFIISAVPPVDDEPVELLPRHAAWLAEARAALVGELRAGATDPAILELAWLSLALAIDHPEVRTGADFVALVEQTSPVAVARTLFLEELHDPGLRPTIERALAGDSQAVAAATAAIRETCGTDEAAEEIRLRALERPDRFRDDLVGVLRRWLERFAAIEPEVDTMLRREAVGRAADVAALEPFDLIEKVTGGIRLFPEPGVRRVVLAPTYFGRPLNHVIVGDDARFIAYPLPDEALGESDPLAPPAALQRFHRALGDETRLRIVRLLADRDWYLTELATKLGLSKPTVKHHLAQLRAAGLATVTEEGSLMYWSLRRERIEDAAQELRRYLG